MAINEGSAVLSSHSQEHDSTAPLFALETWKFSEMRT